MKKKIIVRVIVGILCAPFVLLFLAWIGLSVGKYFIYPEYFKNYCKEAKNPGLNKGYISQGCTYNEDDDYFVTAGYMTKDEPSRIYKIDKKNKQQQYYVLKMNGEDFTGHTGGIQYAKGNFYLADEGTGIYKIPASSLNDSSTVEIGNPIVVNNHSSFIFAEGDYLYVGEFNDDKKYACDNEITLDNKTQKAIVTKYKLDNFHKPVEIYSIGNQIQGFAVTPSGKIVLSRSWGMKTSNFLVYEPEDIVYADMSIDGARVYFLNEDSFTRIVKAPPMTEDLDVKDGKIIFVTECACNKYVLGKFFFDFFIYGLNVD